MRNPTITLSTPSAADAAPVRGRRKLVAAGGVAAALLAMTAGCAVSPAAAGVNSPTTAAPVATATASATATGSATGTASATPQPSATKTAEPNPWTLLSDSVRKKFKSCKSTTVRPGSSGACTTLLQKELKKAGFYPWSVSSYLSVAGVNAVLNYQRSRGLDADGFAGKSTWLALASKAPTVSKELPKTCFTKGVVLCVDQAHRKLYWLRNGEIIKTFKVRLGGYAQHAKTYIWRNFPTANGTWKVYDKQVNPYSENYGSGAMPYSTMFYPDMYVHYSPGFNSSGYASSSHGCVNIRKLSDAQWIFKKTPIGAKVHIYSTKATA
ncbi:L,D-transpeptidase family protein [Micropruina sonneratiae]|uniref:L,D-transpeptidase family protein n=1 Tax=Micropruina sonneratiae TaxID=2986940 RepID=UPI0022276091|nr:L,D-transpeptidase family protein [Micropruina sp. KQZ13P-5]MCW3157905.1 L,D-transpeptidase family protein [Micropruina sp. KQZ13P-5]